MSYIMTTVCSLLALCHEFPHNSFLAEPEVDSEPEEEEEQSVSGDDSVLHVPPPAPPLETAGGGPETLPDEPRKRAQT